MATDNPDEPHGTTTGKPPKGGFWGVIEKLVEMVTGLKGEYRTNIAIDIAYILMYAVFIHLLVNYMVNSLDFPHKDTVIFIAILYGCWEVVFRNIRECQRFITDKLRKRVSPT